MKNAAWRIKHFADGDGALERAGELLEKAQEVGVDGRVAIAEGLIALARAHYRAVEVDAGTRAHAT
jgi:collagenase-like PrtC family protease